MNSPNDRLTPTQAQPDSPAHLGSPSASPPEMPATGAVLSSAYGVPVETPDAPLPVTVRCGLRDPRAAVHAPALTPFHADVLAFLADVSAALLRDPQAKAYPDVMTFAFFCRRANLTQLQKPYASREGRLGRGLVFHIAPSNVPMNFAYSLAAALLAGNASIVKASSQGFEQVRITCTAMQRLLTGAHRALLPYVSVVEYPRERQDVTVQLSRLCDVRILWGGDETIRRVREAPLAPRAFDVPFADRWSLLVCSPAHVLAMDGAALRQAAQGFYNDTYLFDQNACTTPRLVYWLGDGGLAAAAQARFWGAVHAEAAGRYPIAPVVAVEKRIALYRAALTLEGATLNPMPDNLAVRIQLSRLTPAVVDFRCGGGCFLEYAADTLDPLAPLLTSRAQTLSVLGVDPAAVRAWLVEKGVRGVDRLTQMGHTMDFSLLWDGYDLIETLTRRIAI